jgi:hypothetical protein
MRPTDATLGRKYPWALNRPPTRWSEVWAASGPASTGCCRRNKQPGRPGLLLFLERSGYPEETYHTFSYSPLRDDNGTLSACYVVSEDTHQIIGERRMATLRTWGQIPA